MSTQPFSTWSYVADELAERGWTVNDLAERMGGDVIENRHFLALMQNTSDLDVTIGEAGAEGLAIAFGTSAELWLDIDNERRAALDHPEGGDAAK